MWQWTWWNKKKLLHAKNNKYKSIRTDNMDSKTSIVILNWNGSNMLKKFLP